ncbi:uncharacterized protein LOC117579806 [Drosophila guanche]|uniref:Uncharacterized protein n=1 Tax=Drosophila guanche TaxID=7266 RepID=A0A3B0J5S0_DROGU|nr:uncharacterized protein LOC117579806 [Drosophila guanche]SPP77364.1 Hypothetical predicted protein [Drosophila guanche]
MQQSPFLSTLCLFLIIVPMVVYSQSQCGLCQNNNVACVNETHYRFCLDNVEPGVVLPCGDGEVCTSLRKYCAPKGLVDPTCSSGEGSSPIDCPSCTGSSLFVCTSRTTFQMCDGTTLTDRVIKCSDGKFCSMKSAKYCVSECELEDDFECDREAP